MRDRPGKEDAAALRHRLDAIAWLMDNSIPLPGLRYRIGLDGLIGLLPGFGDAVGAIVSSYLLAEAARLGAPKSVLLKMALNVGLDAFLGLIPVVGDLFDLAWKANRRNLRLLEAYLDRPRRTAAASRLFVAVLIIVVMAAVLGILLVGAAAIRWAWRQLTGG